MDTVVCAGAGAAALVPVAFAVGAGACWEPARHLLNVLEFAVVFVDAASYFVVAGVVDAWQLRPLYMLQQQKNI